MTVIYQKIFKQKLPSNTKHRQREREINWLNALLFPETFLDLDLVSFWPAYAVDPTRCGMPKVLQIMETSHTSTDRNSRIAAVFIAWWRLGGPSAALKHIEGCADDHAGAVALKLCDLWGKTPSELWMPEQCKNRKVRSLEWSSWLPTSKKRDGSGHWADSLRGRSSRTCPQPR